MSNSALVTYTKLSPNNGGPRTHVIDTITIHHMAGNLSVEACGRVFSNALAKKSSNYGVNGKNVGLYVDESKRAFTSSNRANDQRAITIELANDANGVIKKTWTVSDETLDTAIKLIADICKRNKIKKLVWDKNKTNRVKHLNGANMTLHKDFAFTACPGPYLESKMSYIAEKVNEIINSSDSNASKPTNTDNKKMYKLQIGAYSKQENANKALAAAKSKGYKDAFVIKQGRYYKLQVGAYSVKANASKALKTAIERGYKNAFIVEV